VSDIIHRKQKYVDGWKGGLPETPCGSGSRRANTVAQRAFISESIRRLKIKTIADIGAGDLNWLPLMNLHGAKCTGYDLVPRHPKVKEFDIIKEIPPKVDMIFCLWVLNHFPPDQAETAWNNLRASGSTWIMLTDRPIWYHDWPACLRDLPADDEITLNEKGDAVMLIRMDIL